MVQEGYSDRQALEDIEWLIENRHQLNEQEAIAFARAVAVAKPELERRLVEKEAQSETERLHREYEQTRKEAEKLKSSFEYFFLEAIQHVEKDPITMGRHINLMCRWLQAVDDGELPNGDEFRELIVNIPPQHTKSLCCSVVYSAWVLARNPAAFVMLVSYSDTLGHLEKCQKLMASDWYLKHFPESAIGRPPGGKKIDSKTEFATISGGRMRVTTPGKAFTGLHPTHIVCFPAGTMVATDKGQVDISVIAQDPDGYRILTHAGRYQKVNRVFRNNTRRLAKITHGAGSLTCTPNHPIWVVGEGWKRADEIVDAARVPGLRGDEADTQKPGDLQYGLSHVARKKTWNAQVRALRKRVLPLPGTRKKGSPAVLQCAVPKRVSRRHRAPSLVAGKAAGVHHLRRRILRHQRNDALDRGCLQRELPAELGAVSGPKDGDARNSRVPAVRSALRALSLCRSRALLKGMRRSHTRSADVRGGESTVHARALRWREGRVPVFPGVSTSKVGRAQSRPAAMSVLRAVREPHAEESPRSPHRRGQGEQRHPKPDQLVCLVPRNNSWNPRPVRVDRTRVFDADCEVFNLDVGTDHTYFADGVLVHNCDDPQNPSRADRKSDRDEVRKWWNETAFNRGLISQHMGKTGRRLVVVMQRLHQLDLSGHLIEKLESVRNLCLPARFEADKKIDHGFGPEWNDWRTKDGEILFPEKFPEFVMRQIEKQVGSYAFAGQYQQRPTSRGGGIFKVDRITRVPKEAIPFSDLQVVIRAWDFASLEGEGDYTAGVMIGMVRDQKSLTATIYVLHVLRGQFSVAQKEQKIESWSRMDSAKYAGRYLVRIPQDPGAAGKDVATILKKRLRDVPIVSETVSGSKLIRATSIASAIEHREVVMLEGDWNADLIDELENFPNGEHDDMVDALSDAYNEAVSTRLYLDDSDVTEEDYLRDCANEQCDRLAAPNETHCCECCRIADEERITLEEHHHDAACNSRHGTLYAQGKWTYA